MNEAHEAPMQVVDGDGPLQLVTFTLRGQEFGIDIHDVLEIIRCMPVTCLPEAPTYVDGLLNLRGKIIPVIDLRTLLGMERRAIDGQSRVVVVRLDRRVLGFVVDEVSQVLRITRDVIEPPPRMVAEVQSELVQAVGNMDDRMLIVLDLNRVLAMTYCAA